MSIRPVDMQVILPQVTDAGKVQATQNNQSNLSQQLFAERLQRESELRQGQVQEATKVEFGKVTREKDAEEEKKKKKKKSTVTSHMGHLLDAEDEHDPKTSAGLDPVLGNNLDITS